MTYDDLMDILNLGKQRIELALIEQPEDKDKLQNLLDLFSQTMRDMEPLAPDWKEPPNLRH
jgi:hypothetical protein